MDSISSFLSEIDFTHIALPDELHHIDILWKLVSKVEEKSICLELYQFISKIYMLDEEHITELV